MTCGHAFKKKHFPTSDTDFVLVNHGSFGLYPQCVFDAYAKAMATDLQSPDRYIRYQQPVEYVEALKQIAPVLNCDYRSLAFVNNATSGVNTVLRSMHFEKGDKIVLPNTTYKACANTVKYLAERYGVEAVVVELRHPLLDAEVVAQFRLAFETPQVKLALFDTVSSMPSFRVPFAELIALCKEYGVLSLVDAAHAIGLVPVDLAALKPDFFTTNLHKWFFMPRACAVLYVDPKHHRMVQTLPVSLSFVAHDAELSPDEEANLLVSKFFYYGSINFAAFACIPEAVRFINDVCGGESAVRDYCEELIRKLAVLVPKKWPGAVVFDNDDKTLLTSMLTFTVPVEKYSDKFDTANVTDAWALSDFVMENLATRGNTFVPLAPYNGKIIARFSALVYNELSDYEYAIDALKASIVEFFAKTEK